MVVQYLCYKKKASISEKSVFSTSVLRRSTKCSIDRELYPSDENMFVCGCSNEYVLSRVSKEDLCFMRRFREYPLIQHWLINSANTHTHTHTHTRKHTHTHTHTHTYTQLTEYFIHIYCNAEWVEGLWWTPPPRIPWLNKVLWRRWTDFFTVPRRRAPSRKVCEGEDCFPIIPCWTQSTHAKKNTFPIALISKECQCGTVRSVQLNCETIINVHAVMFRRSDVSVTCTAESETHKKITFHSDETPLEELEHYTESHKSHPIFWLLFPSKESSF